MKNVQIDIKANVLTITIDLDQSFGPSSSGKTIIVASSEGNIALPDREEKLGINVYRPRRAGDAGGSA